MWLSSSAPFATSRCHLCASWGKLVYAARLLVRRATRVSPALPGRLGARRHGDRRPQRCASGASGCGRRAQTAAAIIASLRCRRAQLPDGHEEPAESRSGPVTAPRRPNLALSGMRKPRQVPGAATSSISPQHFSEHHLVNWEALNDLSSVVRQAPLLLFMPATLPLASCQRGIARRRSVCLLRGGRALRATLPRALSSTERSGQQRYAGVVVLVGGRAGTQCYTILRIQGHVSISFWQHIRIHFVVSVLSCAGPPSYTRQVGAAPTRVGLEPEAARI